ncbi:hypothetical protein [Cerasicoccus frondis]|uniref:hypothetical protein n=1 Tax=Cerasicoccus frondis TaxID=490090 RepID=UPI0028528065|nr:hypothetical protein [Cerasicoccus frondis]
MSKTNAIFCLAHGMNITATKRFVQSLEQCQFSGELVLFLDTSSSVKFKREIPTKLKVRILPSAPSLEQWPSKWDHRRISLWKRVRHYQSLFSKLPDCLTWPLRNRFAQLFLAPHCFRYFRYLDYLRNCRDRYGKILHCDIRDVILQDDPFSWVNSNELLIAMEPASPTIRSSQLNSDWIRAAFGDEALAQVAESAISCSGTTIGDASAMYEYLVTMTSAMSQANARLWNGLGVDQGVHNFLLYTNRLKHVTPRHNGAGPFLTLSGADGIKWELDGANEIRDEQGRLIPIIHQFDRFPDLEAQINKKYLP